jgi:hypothetical protein
LIEAVDAIDRQNRGLNHAEAISFFIEKLAEKPIAIKKVRISAPRKRTKAKEADSIEQLAATTTGATLGCVTASVSPTSPVRKASKSPMRGSSWTTPS